MADTEKNEDNKKATEITPEHASVTEAKRKFTKFFENNKHSKIETNEIEADGKKTIVPYIALPWNDATLEIQIPEDSTALEEALNNLILPERFSAIWHSDSKRLEIQYTAFPLRGNQTDMEGRKFTFIFRDQKYECQFDKSSD